MDLIFENLPWLFSGIGVLLVSGIGKLLYSLIKAKRAKLERPFEIYAEEAALQAKAVAEIWGAAGEFFKQFENKTKFGERIDELRQQKITDIFNKENRQKKILLNLIFDLQAFKFGFGSILLDMETRVNEFKLLVKQCPTPSSLIKVYDDDALKGHFVGVEYMLNLVPVVRSLDDAKSVIDEKQRLFEYLMNNLYDEFEIPSVKQLMIEVNQIIDSISANFTKFCQISKELIPIIEQTVNSVKKSIREAQRLRLNEGKNVWKKEG